MVRRVLAGGAIEFARDRNSICHRVHLHTEDGASRMAVVKVPRPGPQRTNDDCTFAHEAAILARLPETGVVNAHRLLARARVGDGHFLLTSHLPGAHPDPLHHPLDLPRLQGIFDSLFAMDCQGLMHYDLKPANILLDGSQHGFIDFEFARFEAWQDAYAPATRLYCADFNASPNVHFPARTNVANFEFRTFSGYLDVIGQSTSAGDAAALVRDYLHAKSRYHARMGQFLATPAPESTERLAMHGGLTVRQVRQRLGMAAAFADRLAALMRNASAPVVELERALMAFRRHVFERRRQDAHLLRSAAFDRCRRGGIGASGFPADYVEAMAATFDLVWQSSPN